MAQNLNQIENKDFGKRVQEVYYEALGYQAIDTAVYHYNKFGLVLEVNDGKVSDEYIEEEE